MKFSGRSVLNDYWNYDKGDDQYAVFESTGRRFDCFENIIGMGLDSYGPMAGHDCSTFILYMGAEWIKNRLMVRSKS